MAVIILSHSAHFFDDALYPGIDLQLSGHTHAGQIFPLELLCQIYYKYLYGLSIEEDAYLYTSSGVGTWSNLPMRLFSSNEIILLTLKTTL